LKDFIEVTVGSTFEVDITQGEMFRVAVTADAKLFDFITVNNTEKTLNISMDTKGMSVEYAKLRASITMPDLRAANLSGAVKGTIKGFKSDNAFAAVVSGTSELRGTIEAVTIQIKAEGASTVDLAGSAKSSAVKGSGSSTLSLSRCTINSITINLSGTSSAQVNATDELSYDLTGISKLSYAGSPVIKRAEISGLSTATKIK
jgi:hypothetical protein